MQNRNTENNGSPKENALKTAPFPEHMSAANHRVEINQDGDECVVTLLLNSPDSDLMCEAAKSIYGLDDAFKYDFADGMMRLSCRLFMPSGFDNRTISYTVSTLEAAADLIQITCSILQMEAK